MTRRIMLALLVLCLVPMLCLTGVVRPAAAKPAAESVAKPAAKSVAKSVTKKKSSAKKTRRKKPSRSKRSAKARKKVSTKARRKVSRKASPKVAAKPVAKAPVLPLPVLLCPEAVDLGEPFVVRLRAPKAPAGVRLTWLGRQAAVSGRETPDGWEAVVLLGSDVAATSVGRHTLKLRIGAAGARQVLRKAVRVRPVERPVEKLTLAPGMANPPRSALPRIMAEHRQMQELLRLALSHGAAGRRWSLPLVRPVPGEVSSPYGAGRVLNGVPHSPHRGLDLAAASGQEVLAAAAGRVIFSGELYFAGNAVYVDHGQGLVTAYFHLSERRAQAGDEVARGQLLGLAGTTGRSTRPHLHFGVWAFGRYVDPGPLFLYDPLP